MKKAICLTLTLLMLLCGCSHDSSSTNPHTDTPSSDRTFTWSKDGKIVSESGIEYALLAVEGNLYYLGELEFVGSVQGEEKTSQHLGYTYQTGMFAIQGAENDDILVRRSPNNEWCSIYRKASLPSFNFSVDNCVRLELVIDDGYLDNDIIHANCGDGIVDTLEIAKFLSGIRSQKDPKEAGLYDLIKKPNGTLDNCYWYGVIFAFFEEEPNVAIRMEIYSYNDLGYSVTIEGKEYVLPTELLQKLEGK